MAERGMIEFARLADALLDRARSIVPGWLPDGKVTGHEYVCAGLGGGAGRSCSVNLVNGRWADFNSDARGNDLLSLYAAIHGMRQGEAAREIMGQLGWQPSQAVSAPSPAQRSAPPKPPAPAKADEGWATQTPVPAHAPRPTFKHQFRKPEDIEHTAEYRVGDDLYGYVVRFRTSDGGKDPLPYTWCVSARDGAARWHWKQFDEPRPLYLPGHQLPGQRTVIVVEGEKKADALQAVLDTGAAGTYCVVGWPGGCKAWRKAQWAWLAGCHVMAWPDCDAKREPLTAVERRTTPDKSDQAVLQANKPLLPADKQPGMAAMLAIGAHLRDTHGCTVQLLPIPAPGAVLDGWDCADAINRDGWDFARVMGFLAQAFALPADSSAGGADASAADGGGGHEPPAGAVNGSGDGDAFQEHIDYLCEQLKCKAWDLGVNRKLLIAALLKAPALQGCLGYNELTNSPGTTRPWPWRDAAGPLAETDDLRLGDWLCGQYKLKAASRAALAEAIECVADAARYHPIRDWLTTLQWDQRPRSEKWLMHVLGMDPAGVPARRQRYLALMGRFMLMGLVARVMEPGVKFDYSPVFEGITGMGKSTLVSDLVGKAYFSDTHFDIGSGKDGMEQLEGLWAYELSELTAFKRADSEQIKQFFSSTVDRFRGAYGKYVQQHKRQCVIFCTTNKRQYLYDLTGNRRFWPVWIDKMINRAWLLKWREQLFAEAYALWLAGEPFTPTPEEEAAYFVPEQELRLVETTVQSKLYEMLTRDGAPLTEARNSAVMNQHIDFVTLHGLVQALGADAAKSTSLLETQIRGWLDANGWEAMRERTGQRRRGYQRPAVWPPEVTDDEMTCAAMPAREGLTKQATDDPPARVGASVEGGDDEPF